MKKLYLYVLLAFISPALVAQNYTILGNASPMSGCNCFQITPDANDQAGAIFQNNTINLNNSFDFTFNVFLGCRNGNDAADGIMFVLTTNPNGLGNPGEGLGYAGYNQPYSIAVEFDTWENGNAGDPSYDHIGINSGGLYSHNLAGPVPALTNSGNIDNCNWYTVRIVWDVATNTLSVYFGPVGGPLPLRQQIVIPNIVGTYFNNNPVVNWGWSGATGGGTNTQQVCVTSTSNWSAGVDYKSCSTTMQFTDISTSDLGTVQSWAWDFGDGTTSTQQNPSHTYPSTGTYTVTLTITDITGCTYTYTHPVTINPPIVLTPVLTMPLCNGGFDGSVSANSSGGFGPSAGLGGYQYSWNGGANVLQTYNGVGAGTYTLTVTDGICTTTAQYTLNQPPALTAATSHTDANCGLNNGTATITIMGGTPPYTPANWGTGGICNPNPTCTVTGLMWGTYPVDFRDANSCSSLLSYREVVNQLPCGINASSSSTNVTCFGGSNGTATLTVTGGSPPSNISWSNGGSGATITGLPANTYTYTYTDQNPANTFTGSVVVTQPGAAMAATITALDMSCANTNDGMATANVVSGGISPYTYNWSRGTVNGAVTSGLSPGPVSVTITDASGCTASATANITGPPLLTLNVTTVNDSCYQGETGSATANVSGGNPPYLFYWSNISSAQTNLSLTAGTYTVTVTDNKGCTITGSATINEPTDITYTITPSQATCGANGSISVTASGGTPGYTYAWTPATATGQNPAGLSAGQYVLTLTDSYNCRKVDSTVITQPAGAFTVTSSHTNITCNGANDGTITVTITGGTPPYTYQGLPVPPGTTVIPNLPPGTYGGPVTDAAGCSDTVSETITEPTALIVTEIHTDATCNGAPDGSIDITCGGGGPPYMFLWSNGSTTEDLVNIPAACYTVSVTDTSLCSVTMTICVTEPPALSMPVTTTDAACFGGNGSATANPAGSGPFTYSWSFGGSTQTIPAPAGSHTVTATDASSCNQTGSFIINSPPDMIVAETHTNILCFGNATGDITLTTSGGNGSTYTYSWNPNVSAGNSAGSLTAGVYDISVTDSASCVKTISVTLTEPAQPIILSAQPTDVSCFGLADGSITANVTGGVPAYNFVYSDGTNSFNSSTGQFNSLASGNYTITVTDQNSCTATGSAIVNEPALLTNITDTFPALCYQSSDGRIVVSPLGGVSPFTFSLSSGSTNATGIFAGLSAGTYDVTVTDANGCTTTGTGVITEPDSVTLSVSPPTAEVDFGASLQLTTTTNQTGILTYNWAPAAGLSCSDCPNPAFDGNNSQVYIVTMTNANGCTGTAQFVVTVIPNTDLFIPNVFTPNGDGTNDYWQLFGNLKAIKQLDVMVFNRWGEKVFEGNEINFKWDGTYKGERVPPGVYVYTAKFVWLNNHSDNNYKGSITVLR